MATYFCRLADPAHGHTPADARPIDVPDSEYAGRHGRAARAAELYAQWYDNTVAEYPASRAVVVVGPGEGGPGQVFDVEMASVPEYIARPKREGK